MRASSLALAHRMDRPKQAELPAALAHLPALQAQARVPAYPRQALLAARQTDRPTPAESPGEPAAGQGRGSSEQAPVLAWLSVLAALSVLAPAARQELVRAMTPRRAEE